MEAGGSEVKPPRTMAAWRRFGGKSSVRWAAIAGMAGARTLAMSGWKVAGPVGVEATGAAAGSEGCVEEVAGEVWTGSGAAVWRPPRLVRTNWRTAESGFSRALRISGKASVRAGGEGRGTIGSKPVISSGVGECPLASRCKTASRREAREEGGSVVWVIWAVSAAAARRTTAAKADRRMLRGTRLQLLA